MVSGYACAMDAPTTARFGGARPARHARHGEQKGRPRSRRWGAPVYRRPGAQCVSVTPGTGVCMQRCGGGLSAGSASPHRPSRPRQGRPPQKCTDRYTRHAHRGSERTAARRPGGSGWWFTWTVGAPLLTRGWCGRSGGPLAADRADPRAKSNPSTLATRLVDEASWSIASKPGVENFGQRIYTDNKNNYHRILAIVVPSCGSSAKRGPEPNISNLLL